MRTVQGQESFQLEIQTRARRGGRHPQKNTLKAASEADRENCTMLKKKKKNERKTEKMVKEEGWIKCDSPFYSALIAMVYNAYRWVWITHNQAPERSCSF